MNQSLLERAKKDGVILVFHSYMWEHGDKLASYGEKRLRMIHPYRTAIDLGIHVAGHSDSTVSAADPLLRIQDMVTRKGPDGREYGPNQRVTVEEALKVWTLDGAYTTFDEKIKGSNTPGKLADFVVLRKDPRRVDPDGIKDIVVDYELSRHKRLFGSRRRCRCAGISMPTDAASGEPAVFHGLLPCHCVVDIGRSPFTVVCPAFQAGRKGARTSLRTSQERQYTFRSNSYFEEVQ
jgi:hypothetical protein